MQFIQRVFSIIVQALVRCVVKQEPLPVQGSRATDSSSWNKSASSSCDICYSTATRQTALSAVATGAVDCCRAHLLLAARHNAGQARYRRRQWV